MKRYEGIRRAYPNLPLPLKVRSFAQLSRPVTAISGVVVGLLGTAVACNLSPQRWFDVRMAIVASIILVSLQVYGQVVNQICDIEIDRINKSWRPLPSGRIRVWEAEVYSLLLVFLALSIPLVLRNLTALLLSMIGLIVATAYSVPPIRVKRNAWLSALLLAFARGMLPVFLVWSLVSRLDLACFLFSLIPFSWMLAFNWSKDFGDEKGDLACGVETIPILLGRNKARELMFCMSILFLLSSFTPLFVGVLPMKFTFLSTLYPLGVMIPITVTVEDERLENNVGWFLMYLGLGLIYVLALIATVV